MVFFSLVSLAAGVQRWLYRLRSSARGCPWPAPRGMSRSHPSSCCSSAAVLKSNRGSSSGCIRGRSCAWANTFRGVAVTRPRHPMRTRAFLAAVASQSGLCSAVAFNLAMASACLALSRAALPISRRGDFFVLLPNEARMIIYLAAARPFAWWCVRRWPLSL